MDDLPSNAQNTGSSQTGNPNPADELFARYAHRLTRFAEGQISPILAARLDPEDVVQSVFRTFFRRSDKGEFVIDTSGQIWQLLVTITLMKARAKGRYHTASKRDAGAEVNTAANDWLVDALARDPSPEDAVDRNDFPCFGADSIIRHHVLRTYPAAERIWQVSHSKKFGARRDGRSLPRP